jgi:hypothetical protein
VKKFPQLKASEEHGMWIFHTIREFVKGNFEQMFAHTPFRVQYLFLIHSINIVVHLLESMHIN